MTVAGLIALATGLACSPALAARGDANGDGFDDLAVGITSKAINGQVNCGAVHVIYGSHGGLRVNGDQYWHQDQTGINNSCGAFDHFGSALAWGDFDDDGFDDLAIGVPGETVANFQGAGAVQVLYGSSGGLDSAGDQLWHQDSTGITDSPEEGDNFGAALAVGDFDGDGFDDLAIGVRNESVGTIDQAGAVHIIYGSNSGLKAAGDEFFHQDSSGVNDQAEQEDHFGDALAAGDFNGDGLSDLAIGVPEEDLLGAGAAGAVNVLYGSNSGLRASGDQFWHQDSPGVKDVAEEDDQFGGSLAAGDFDDDGRDDLVIGVEFEDIGAVEGAGAINVLYGSNNGLTDAGDQFLHQDSPGIRDQAEQGDGLGRHVSAGDFDGDGHADLAIGLGDEDLEDLGIGDASAVAILYGSNGGLTDAGDQFLHQDSPGINGTAEEEDRFGGAVVCGDFDGDGNDDLAIGASGEDVPLEPGQTITKVAVQLFNFSHLVPGDVDILLVGPGGQNVILMSDVGAGTDAVDLDIMFDDDAAASLATPLVSGIFKPTNNVAGDTFPAPAPIPSGSTSLADFIGTSPLGDWQLFVVDDVGSDSGGDIESWALVLETIGPSYNTATITIPIGGAAAPYPSIITIENDAVQDAGSVHVLYGSHGGLSSQGDQVFHQNSEGINSTAREGDSFGSVL